MDLPDRSNNNHVDYVSFIYQRTIKVIELNYEPMSLRPPRGVHRAQLHQAFKPCFIRAVPPQTY